MPKDKRDRSTTDHREAGDRREHEETQQDGALEEYTDYRPTEGGESGAARPEEAEATREAELQPSEEDTEGVEPDRDQ